MLTPACPRLLDMINDFVLLRFWARAPRGFKRYRSYIILLLYYYLILGGVILLFGNITYFKIQIEWSIVSNVLERSRYIYGLVTLLTRRYPYVLERSRYIYGLVTLLTRRYPYVLERSRYIYGLVTLLTRRYPYVLERSRYIYGLVTLLTRRYPYALWSYLLLMIISHATVAVLVKYHYWLLLFISTLLYSECTRNMLSPLPQNSA